MNKKIYKILLILIIVLAFIVRIVFALNIPFYQMQHDVVGKDGALDYIFTIYNEGHLPTTNENQFYHPPLHHILSACWLKVMSLFIHSNTGLLSSLQFLTIIYSMLILYVVYNILKEFKFDKKIRLLLMFLVAFHPTMLILSRSLNNDELCFLLMLWSILRLTKWYKKPSVKNTIILAITTGLSVITKMTGALIAVPIALTFIQKLHREIKKSKDKKKTFLKYLYTYILFGIVSLPIGLWYPIRNYIKFNQTLLYILPPGGDSPYTKEYTLLDRFLPYSNELLKMYCNPNTNINMPIYLLKCSIFGEYYWGDNILNLYLYILAMISNVVLILFTLFAMLKNIFSKNKRNIIIKIILFITWIFTFLSYISVNIKLPFGCTMDFRYVLINLFIGITFIGFELSNLLRKNKKLYSNVYSVILTLVIVLILSTYVIIFRKIL